MESLVALVSAPKMTPSYSFMEDGQITWASHPRWPSYFITEANNGGARLGGLHGTHTL